MAATEAPIMFYAPVGLTEGTAGQNDKSKQPAINILQGKNMAVDEAFELPVCYLTSMAGPD